MNFFSKIRKSPLFESFTDAEINKLFDCFQARIILTSRGKIIARENQEVSELGIILSGEALVFYTRPNGEREATKKLESGDSFGLVQGYLTPNVLGYYVIAASDAEVLYLKISGIVNMCEEACPCHQKLIHSVIKGLSERINELEDNNSYMALKGMRAKIAKLIYDKSMEQNTLNVVLGFNRNDMAKYLNVSRPSMSREMIRMREEGIFDFWKDQITIKNIAALEAIVKKK